MTSSTIPVSTTNYAEELTLRMLGDNITFRRTQWENLLDELDADGDLHRRVTELLAPQPPSRTSTLVAADLCVDFEVKAEGAPAWSIVRGLHYSGGPGTGMPAKVTAVTDWGSITYGADEEVVVHGDHLNRAQRDAVQVSVENFKASDEAELIDWQIVDPRKWAFGKEPQDGIYVEFHYALATDEANAKPHLEVHVYAADGKVLDSQDFG